MLLFIALIATYRFMIRFSMFMVDMFWLIIFQARYKGTWYRFILLMVLWFFMGVG